jgi:uncharacterized membrane protein
VTWIANALALLASIAYGAADFLGGLATKRGSTVFSAVVCSQATGLLLVLLALPFLPAASPTAPDLAWGAASGLAGGIGLALLYRGLAVGVMSVVAPVTAVCAVIIPVAVGLALGERPASPASLGVALAVVSIVLISRSGGMEDGKSATTGLATAIASGIAIGIFLVCLERTGPSAGLWPLVPARVVSVFFFAVAGALAREKLLPRRESWPIRHGRRRTRHAGQHPVSARRPAGTSEHRRDIDLALSGQHDPPGANRPARTPSPRPAGGFGVRGAGDRADRVRLSPK